jgi:hypothetical protein
MKTIVYLAILFAVASYILAMEVDSNYGMLINKEGVGSRSDPWSLYRKRSDKQRATEPVSREFKHHPLSGTQ